MASSTITHAIFTGVLLVLLGMVSVITYTSTQGYMTRLSAEEEKAIAVYMASAIDDLREAAKYARPETLVLRKVVVPRPSKLNINYAVRFTLLEDGGVAIEVSPRGGGSSYTAPLGGDVVTLGWLSWASGRLIDPSVAASVRSDVLGALSDAGLSNVDEVYSSQPVYIWIYRVEVGGYGYLSVVGWGVRG